MPLELTSLQSPSLESPQPLQPKVAAALQRLWPDSAAADWQVLSYLEGGYRNANYRVRYRTGETSREFALRLSSEPDRQALQREVQLLSELPELFAALTIEMGTARGTLRTTTAQAWDYDHGLLLTEWRDEPLLAGQAGLAPEQLADYLATLHTGLSRLTTAPPNQTDLLDDVATDLTLACKNASVTEAEARNRLAEIRRVFAASVQQPSHLDLNPWNLLYDGRGSWVTLDWETQSLAHPLFDLVCLTEGYLRTEGRLPEAPGFTTTAIAHYSRQIGRAFSEPELDAARSLFRLREFAWAGAQIAAGNNREEVLEQYADYARLLAEDGINVVAR